MGLLSIFRLRTPTLSPAAFEAVSDAPAKKRRDHVSAEVFLKPAYAKGQRTAILKGLMAGQVVSGALIKAPASRGGLGIACNDVGHRISDVRKCLALSGVTLKGQPVNNGGKRHHQYWISPEDIEKLALLHRRVNEGE